MEESQSTVPTNFKATFGSRTDIGCVREHNEDSLVVSPPLFVVADGMGGHAAGEVASEIAVTIISERAPDHADSQALAQAICLANQEIIRAAQEGRGREGMGTTVTAALLEGERLIVAQVGDSRAYLLHQGRLQQITRDHSLVADMIHAGQLTEEEARVHPQRSVITRALGSDPSTQPDIYEINVESGDRLLLCSDGLSGMVDDSNIEQIMQSIRDPQRCANTLVDEAITAGGHDNVTAIIADVEGFQAAKEKKSAFKIKKSILFTVFALVLVCILAVVGFNAYVGNSAYLGEQDGKVALYKGVPGISSSAPEYVSDIKLEDLEKPGVSQRIKDGLQVDSLDAGARLIEEYQTEIDEKKATQTDLQNSQKKGSDQQPNQNSQENEGSARS